MSSLWQKYKKLPIYYRFIINGLTLYLIWLLFFKGLKNLLVVDYFYEKGIFYISVLQLKLTSWFLGILGYKTQIYGKIIKIIGSYGVHLDKGCLGRNTLGLFIGFILAYPGNFKSKLWFIPVGIIIFITLNVLRISALAILDFCCREYLDFNHHFTFKIIVYAIIFLLWVFWIKKYGEKLNH